jgi:hypothetical protein
MSVDPGPARRHLSKRHPNVKGDSRFLGQDDHGTERADCRQHGIEQRAYLGRLPSKMSLEIVQPAGMGLISIGERSLASRTLPQRPHLT